MPHSSCRFSSSSPGSLTLFPEGSRTSLNRHRGSVFSTRASASVLASRPTSNPTGACYAPEDLEPIARVCAERDIWIIADEIYSRLLYDGEEHAGYYREITVLDRQLGRLRRELREMEIADDTILWYCSDNGALPDVGSTAGLRGFKGEVYEGGLRVPAIVEWPARIPRPRATPMTTPRCTPVSGCRTATSTATRSPMRCRSARRTCRPIRPCGSHPSCPHWRR